MKYREDWNQTDELQIMNLFMSVKLNTEYIPRNNADQSDVITEFFPPQK